MISDTTLNVAEAHPVAKLQPKYLHRTSWAAHIPFAMFLADVLRPRCFVELGTYYGVSYMAFCQAFEALGLRPASFAVDTWQGDAQIGEYAGDVLETLQRSHDPAYGAFSSLLQETFDAAVSRFADGSIDLLHIDGYHTYEAVRHDFETWLPKLSSRGVVLLHDTAERNEEMNFGVWRFWAELANRYPSFEFTHEHGLGIVAVGPERSPTLDIFFNAGPGERQHLRWQFCELALTVKNAQLVASEAAERELESQLRAQVAQLEQLGAGQEALIEALRQQVAMLEQLAAGLEMQRASLQQQLAAESQSAEVKDSVETLKRLLEAREAALRHADSERRQLYQHVNVLNEQLMRLSAERQAPVPGLRNLVVTRLREVFGLRAS